MLRRWRDKKSAVSLLEAPKLDIHDEVRDDIQSGRVHIKWTGNEKITDEVLSYLTSVNQDILSIDLGLCTAVTKDGLIELLEKEPNLQRLSVSRNPSLFSSWKSLSSMQDQNEHKKEVAKQQKCLQAFINHPSLSELDLSASVFFPEQGVKILFKSQLVSLDLSEVKSVNDDACKDLISNDWMQRLKVINCANITDIGISNIGKMKHLTHLSIANCTQLSNRCIMEIGKIRGLEYLDVRSCTHINANFFVFRNLHYITHLDLSELRITDSEMIVVAYMDSLISLRLAGCEYITNVGVSSLGNHRNLRNLNVSRCKKLTQLNVLATLPNLVNLSVGSNAQLSAKTLRRLLKYSALRLESLNLNNINRLTDGMIEELKNSTKLSFLSIHSCPLITNRSLVTLTQCKSLKTLEVHKTKVSAEAFRDWPSSYINPACIRGLIKAERVVDITGGENVLEECITEPITSASLQKAFLSGCKRVGNAVAVLLAKNRNVVVCDLRRTGVTASAFRGQTTHLQMCVMNAVIDETHALDLTGCSRAIDNEVLGDLCGNRNLKSVTLYGCDRVTDEFIEKMRQKSLGRITLTDTRSQIKDLGIDNLYESIQELGIINLASLDGVNDALVKELSGLKYLSNINLSGCSNVTDEGARNLALSNSLEFVELNGTSVTEGAFCEQKLSYLNPAVVLGIIDIYSAIDLSDCSAVTVDVIRGFFTCNKLVTINISGCSGIEDSKSANEAFDLLVQNPSVDHLFCGDLHVSDKTVLAVAEKDRLLSLGLPNSPMITNAALLALASTTKLEWLDVRGTEQDKVTFNVFKGCEEAINPAVLLAVAKARRSIDLSNLSLLQDDDLQDLCNECPEMFRLNIAYCRSLTNATVNAVSSLSNLHYLDISGCSVTSIARILRCNKKLWSLKCNHCWNFFQENAVEIASHPVLQSLEINRCPFTEGDMAMIARDLKTVKSLTCEACEINEASLKSFADNDVLNSASFRNCRAIDDSACEILSTIRNLTNLDISATKITDKGLESIAKLEWLRVLNLSSTNIEGTNLKHIVELSRLQTLMLCELSLLPKAILMLRSSNSLGYIDLRNSTNQSNDLKKDIKAFQKSNKDVFINYSHELIGSENVEILEIESVVPLSGKAGTVIVINGFGFGAASENLSLFIGPYKCDNLQIMKEDIELTCVCPNGDGIDHEIRLFFVREDGSEVINAVAEETFGFEGKTGKQTGVDDRLSHTEIASYLSDMQKKAAQHAKALTERPKSVPGVPGTIRIPDFAESSENSEIGRKGRSNSYATADSVLAPEESAASIMRPGSSQDESRLGRLPTSGIGAASKLPTSSTGTRYQGRYSVRAYSDVSTSEIQPDNGPKVVTGRMRRNKSRDEETPTSGSKTQSYSKRDPVRVTRPVSTVPTRAVPTPSIAPAPVVPSRPSSMTPSVPVTPLGRPASSGPVAPVRPVSKVVSPRDKTAPPLPGQPARPTVVPPVVPGPKPVVPPVVPGPKPVVSPKDKAKTLRPSTSPPVIPGQKPVVSPRDNPPPAVLTTRPTTGTLPPTRPKVVPAVPKKTPTKAPASPVVPTRPPTRPPSRPPTGPPKE